MLLLGVREGGEALGRPEFVMRRCLRRVRLLAKNRVLSEWGLQNAPERGKHGYHGQNFTATLMVQTK